MDTTEQSGLIGAGNTLTIYGTSKAVPYGSEAEYDRSDSRMSSYSTTNMSSYKSEMTGRPVIGEFSKRVYLGKPQCIQMFVYIMYICGYTCITPKFWYRSITA